MLINEEDVSLEVLQDLFKTINVSSSIVEVYPAAPKMKLDRDAYLEISYPDRPPVIIWIDTQAKLQLRFRVIIAKDKEREKFKNTDLQRWAAGNNQQLDYFGSLSTEGINITLEHRLPYQDAIASSTIVSVAQCIAEGAMAAQQALVYKSKAFRPVARAGCA